MLNKIKFKPIYRTHRDSIDQIFYVPCFSESIRMDRAAGYFSLHSLILSIDGLICFVRKGGIINVICSPDLSQEDAELIDACISLDKEHVTRALIDSITGCQMTDDEYNKLDVVCNMLSEGKMVIKIAYQPLGIFHEKFGIFSDEDNNKVYFNGSMNETRRALIYNQESIRVNWSWQSDFAEKFIEREQNYFDTLWEDKDENVTVINFPDAVKNDLFNIYKRSETLEAAIDKYIQSNITKGKKTLYTYQEKAIQEFCDNGYRHFYEMATGTGKTFTSIKTIRRLQNDCKEKKFIIVCVPQIDLQTQWESALLEEGYGNIYLFGGNGGAFDMTISKAIIDYYSDEEDVICVSVYDTFFSKVYEKIRNIAPLFIIVDEAHNLTPGNLLFLERLNPKYRLGLSATIQRFNEGESDKIVRFFTPTETFYYGIEDAIENGFLSKYEYHPLFVRLTDEEQERFNNKSKLLAQEINKEKPDPELLDRLRRERSLIVKQASQKIDKLEELIDDDYNFINSVVYCGQGKDSGGDSIIDTVTQILNNKRLTVSQFTSHTLDRKKVLYEFEHGYYDTLVAIRCFDEGVDVPKLDKIYILASDSALRQTVQRRGRVLRKCKESGKTIAYIYDMIVLPALSAGTSGSSGLLKIELSRAREYNRLALNNETNESVFRGIEERYNINLNEDNTYESESD